MSTPPENQDEYATIGKAHYTTQVPKPTIYDWGITGKIRTQEDPRKRLRILYNLNDIKQRATTVDNLPYRRRQGKRYS